MSKLKMIVKKFFGQKDNTQNEKQEVSKHITDQYSVTLSKQGWSLFYDIQDQHNNTVNLKVEYVQGDFKTNSLSGHKIAISVNGINKYKDIKYLGSREEGTEASFLSKEELNELKNVLKKTEFSYLNNCLFYGKSWEDMQKYEQFIKQKEEEALRRENAAFDRAEPIFDYKDSKGRVAVSRENGSLFYDISDNNNNIITLKLTYFNYAYHPSDPIDKMTGHHMTIRVNGEEKLCRDVYLGHRFAQDAKKVLSPKEIQVLSQKLRGTKFGNMVATRLPLVNKNKTQPNNNMAMQQAIKNNFGTTR